MFVEKKPKDIETVISTIDQHRKRGRVFNERSTHSPNVSHKITQRKPNS